MSGKAPRRAHGRPLPDGPAPFTTLVELTFHKQKIEHWIRFGRKSYEQILDRRRSVVGFAPDSIFAFVRWASGEHGTIISRIDIVRAIGRGEPFQTLPFVRPGGDILLRLDSWAKAQRALAAIEAVEALAAFMVERGYIGRGVPLLKRVAGLPGQRVCRLRATITVDGFELGHALDRDRIGRDLPVWQGCWIIADGQLFLMNWQVRDSLDGRYFGPVPAASVIGRAVSLWTDEEGDGRYEWRAQTGTTPR